MKDGAKIYFKDWGAGPVVTFSHGWPLTADAWDAQMLFLASKARSRKNTTRVTVALCSAPWLDSARWKLSGPHTQPTNTASKMPMRRARRYPVVNNSLQCPSSSWSA